MKTSAFLGKGSPFISQILILMHQKQLLKTLGREEIAHYKQFLLFPQRFLLNQKTVPPSVNIYDIISLLAAELGEPKIGM